MTTVPFAKGVRRAARPYHGLSEKYGLFYRYNVPLNISGGGRAFPVPASSWGAHGPNFEPCRAKTHSIATRVILHKYGGNQGVKVVLFWA